MLVIGSGASGAVASMVLGQAGLDVVCLEQGGWITPELVGPFKGAAGSDGW